MAEAISRTPAILLNSGGKDTLAVAMLSYERYALHSLFIDVGRKDGSQVAAKKIADKYCVSHQVFPLPVDRIPDELNKSKIPDRVEHQGVLFHGLAAALAGARGIGVIVSGHRIGPVAREWAGLMQSLLNASKISRPVTLELPIFHLASPQVFDIVKGEPLWSETVTCNLYPPCGSCPKCKLRAQWLGV